MTIIERIDACITDMQAVCNSCDELAVEEIAQHVADELAVAKSIVTDLLAACNAVVDWDIDSPGGDSPTRRAMVKKALAAIAKAGS